MAISPKVVLGETVGNGDGRTVFFGTVFLSQVSGSVARTCKRWGRARRTMVLSETRLEAGLRLIRVLREGP
jgi:hypothetical protein